MANSDAVTGAIQTIQDLDTELNLVNQELDEIEVQLIELNQRKRALVERKERLKDEKLRRRSEARNSELDWEANDFEWSESVRKTLRDTFRLSSFRPQQLKTINAVLNRRDVLLIAPTGGGKSLCYQLPAVLSKGITVVISPLISLMEDQVWSLNRVGVEAMLFSANGTDKETAKAIMDTLGDKPKVGKMAFKLLYVTPERLAKSKRFMTALQKAYANGKLELFAIDEVHCVSQWGHDFRPDYKFLGTLKTLFPDVPILGVTATATAKVIVDIQKMLNIRNCVLFSAPFNRPNLYYHVLEKPAEKEKVLDLLAGLLKGRYRGQTGIIYTFSIKDAEELAAGLLQRDVKVRPYHANLESENRTRIHSRWLQGEIQAVVATVAFGMGIDKPNVRFVIHHTMSKSMENFYQESGRAGRDGRRAECLLLFRFADIFKITTMMFTEHTGLRNAYAMIEYCINATRCRRDLISRHFAEVWQAADCRGMCDICARRGEFAQRRLEVAADCRTLQRVVRLAEQLKMNLTGAKLVDCWFNKGAPQLRVEKTTPKFDRTVAEKIVAHLLVSGHLKEDFAYTPYSTLSYIKCGTAVPAELSFECAKAPKLPELPEEVDDDDDDDVVLVAPKRKKKSIIVESDDEEQPSLTQAALQVIENIKTEGTNPKGRRRKVAANTEEVIEIDE